MKELIEKLKKRAESFLKIAKISYKEKDYDISMFSLEQAVQLLLKAKILEFNVSFPKTHDIFELIEFLKKLNFKIKVEKYKEIIEKLNITYISSRYLPTSFSEKEVKKALEFVEKLKKTLWK